MSILQAAIDSLWYWTYGILVAEAPYHPGYEDAVVEKPRPNYHEHEETLAKEINELFKVKNRHTATSKKIVEFIKNGYV